MTSQLLDGGDEVSVGDGVRVSLNVGIVTTWFERGAAHVSRQLEATLAAEYDVFIYARGEFYDIGNPAWDRDNVHWGARVTRVGSSRIEKQDFVAWMHTNKIDVIIFNEQRWWQPIIWAKRAGRVVGAYIDYYTQEDVALFSAYDFLLCMTERHYEVFSWHGDAFLVPWGTDTRVFHPSKTWPYTPERVTFFHSCGMAPHRKGTDLVIRAFDLVKRQTDARLVIHSQVPLVVDDVDLDDIDIRVETVPPPGLYALGDVYVYPSRLDGLGLTVCEALSCGLPVVTPACAPMCEFVTDGHNGSLIRVSKVTPRSDGYYWPEAEVDISDLACAMMAIAQDREKLGSMKRAAREYAVEQRDWGRNGRVVLAAVAGSVSRPLSRSLERRVSRYDRRGLKGKIDIMLGIPFVGRALASVVELYQRRRGGASGARGGRA